MTHIKCYLFGPPRLKNGDNPIALNHRKAQALLAYLTVTAQPHSRDALATLLWPDQDQATARTYLRRELARLRSALGQHYFIADRELLALNLEAELWLDVNAFHAHIRQAQQCPHGATEACDRCLPHLSAAAELYTDDFLAGFTLADSAAFDDWQFFQTEELRQTLAGALARLVQGHSATHHFETALPYARRWLALDPLHEPAHRQLMQIYEFTGQHAAAVRQYEACVTILATELGVEPQPETTRLFEEIRQQAGVRGQRIAGYYLLEQGPETLLGEGGMGQVYRGKDIRNGQPVAIKILKPQLVEGTPDILARFKREGDALRRLNHPNIIKFLATEQSDQNYLVLEYVGGGSLRDLLQSKGKLPLEQMIAISLELADALTQAHHLNIIHRDLKLANVLLTEAGAPCLTDFGVALIQDKPALTQTGLILGTVDYLSPEACNGEKLDTRSDIWSLGIMMWEMLTGERPFKADSIIGLLAAILTQPLPDLAQYYPEIPRPLQHLINRMLEKERDQRLASMRQVGVELEAVQRGDWDSQITTFPDKVAVLDESTATQQPPPEAISVTPPTGVTTKPFVPAPRPAGAPSPTNIVTRKDVLLTYTQQLTREHLVVITGMPGVGKTTLAAVLARESVSLEHIFWHSFYPGQGATVVIWKLAAFLAWQDQPDLWQMLQGAQQSGGQLPPTDVLFDFALEGLRGQPYLLCFDDFHHVADDPDVDPLLDRLLRLVKAGETRLILTTGRIPDFLPPNPITPLTGLTLTETQELIHLRQLALTPAQTDPLHRLTEGNTEFLNLALNALEQSRHPDRLLERLAEADNIERYLLNEVDAALSEDERRVLGAVAALLGYPGTRTIIETLLEGGRIRRPLRDLCDRFLLFTQDSAWGREYFEHSILRLFYYDNLSRAERRRMHHEAAIFYESDEPDRLRAALHYERAGEHERAAELVTADVWVLINQGLAQPAIRLLERLTRTPLNPQMILQLNLALGQLLVFVGQGRSAQDRFHQALSQLAHLSDPIKIAQFKARIYLGLGELLRYEDPSQALAWLYKGLSELTKIETPFHQEEAALRIRAGNVQWAMGNYPEALALLQQGIQLLPSGPSQWRAIGLLNLGNVYDDQGDPQQATEIWQQALHITRNLNDHYWTLVILSNLGIGNVIAGAWQAAEEAYHQALTLAKQLGNIREQARIENSIGWLQATRGDHNSARTHLAHALDVVRTHNLRDSLPYVLNSLALLHLRTHEGEQAQSLLREAEEIAIVLDIKWPLVETTYLLAEGQLSAAQPGTAAETIERALTLARDLALDREEGICLGILGQIRLAQGRQEAALTAFEQSLTLLTDRDPYEAARTKAAWGRALLAGGLSDRGLALLKEAQATFKVLGAQRDLAQITLLWDDFGAVLG